MTDERCPTCKSKDPQTDRWLVDHDFGRCPDLFHSLVADRRCGGDGEFYFNPGWPDPQTEDSVPCPGCPDCSPVGEPHEWDEMTCTACGPLERELTAIRERVEELESLLGKALAFIPPPHPRFQGPGAPLMTQVIHALDRPLNPDTQDGGEGRDPACSDPDCSYRSEIQTGYYARGYNLAELAKVQAERDEARLEAARWEGSFKGMVAVERELKASLAKAVAGLREIAEGTGAWAATDAEAVLAEIEGDTQGDLIPNERVLLDDLHEAQAERDEAEVAALRLNASLAKAVEGLRELGHIPIEPHQRVADYAIAIHNRAHSILSDLEGKGDA